MTLGSAPVRGDYLVDAATALPPEPPWVGRVQQTLHGRVQLVTHTGYEWWTDPRNLREATQQERDAYDAERRYFLRPWWKKLAV